MKIAMMQTKNLKMNCVVDEFISFTFYNKLTIMPPLSSQRMTVFYDQPNYISILLTLQIQANHARILSNVLTVTVSLLSDQI